MKRKHVKKISNTRSLEHESQAINTGRIMTQIAPKIPHIQLQNFCLKRGVNRSRSVPSETLKYKS